MIEFAPNDHETAIWQRAQTYAQDVLADRAIAHDGGLVATDSLKDLAKLGLLTVKADEKHGGLGGSSVAYAGAMRAVAKVCPSTAVMMATTNMVAEMVGKFGTDEQQARFLPLLSRGERTAGAFALSEPAFGSDAAGLQCRAVWDEASGEYVLDGGKMWITAGDIAGVTLIMARTSDAARAGGISAFLVQLPVDGYSAGRHEKKMGLRGSTTVALNLEGLRVPVANRLADEGMGFRIAMTALDSGRCGIGAQAVGMGEAALEAAVKAVKARGKADKIAGLGQSTDFRIADVATRLSAAWLMVLRASALKDAGKRVTRQAAMAKVFATEAANFACQQMLEVAGPEALNNRSAVARALRDVRVSRIYEGTSEIQRMVIGRDLAAGL